MSEQDFEAQIKQEPLDLEDFLEAPNDQLGSGDDESLPEKEDPLQFECKVEIKSEPSSDSDEAEEASASDNHESLQCSKCSIKYSSRSSYRNHVVSCQGIIVQFPPTTSNNNIDPSSTSIQSSSLNNYEDIRRSIKILERSCFGDIAVDDEEGNAGSKSENYYCSECDETFHSLKRYAHHAFAHTFMKKTVEEQERAYICSDCGKDFHNKALMDEHLTRRTVVFPCVLCRQLFTRKDNLREHLKVHAGAKNTRRKYECKECGKSFGGVSLLLIHKRSHGQGEQHACQQCKKTFVCRAALEKHTRRHTGEKPYKCSVCRASFGAIETLNRHLTTHKRVPVVHYPNSIATQIRFPCDQCTMTFSTQNHLQCHKNSHSEGGYSCHLCPIKFTFLYKLEIHMKFTHPRADKLACSLCDMQLLTKEHLKTHIEAIHNRPNSGGTVRLPVASSRPKEDNPIKTFSFPTESKGPKTYNRKRKAATNLSCALIVKDELLIKKEINEENI